MPELPEVETTRRFLEPVLVRRRIMAADVRRARMVRHQPGDFPGRVVGRTIRSLRRHGKFMLADLSGDMTWVTHLGMSGRISVARRGSPEVPHTNVVIRVGGGTELRFVDPRTFGFVVAYTPEELAASSIARLGPDVLDDPPSPSLLASRLAGRTAPVKALLLDQRIVAGLGNIYADEALHRAGIDPRRSGGSLDEVELRRLSRAIGSTMADGLAWGGTSLDDLAYLLPDGRAGEFAERLAVYGRGDEPCGTCGTPIRQVVLRQRSTHWCPICQR
jgi:formamidopyrimidine-DNA glycosylase